MAKEIPLKGYGNQSVAIVDDSDYDYLSQWEWRLKDTGYAFRDQWIPGSKGTKGKNKIIRMHRVVNQTPDDMFTDHINHNPLDNRKCNLRTVTHAQNMQNIKKGKHNRSGYIGVSYHYNTKLFRCTIYHAGKQIQIGYFKSELEAAKAWNQKALELRGKYANLNIIPNGENDHEP